MPVTIMLASSPCSGRSGSCSRTRSGRTGLNCDLSSGICADDDVLDALRRDQERAHLRSRRARRPGTTRKHESSVEVVTGLWAARSLHALQFQPWQGRTKAITTTSVVGVTIDLENQSNIRTIDGCHHETGRGGYPRRSDTRPYVLLTPAHTHNSDPDGVPASALLGPCFVKPSIRYRVRKARSVTVLVSSWYLMTPHLSCSAPNPDLVISRGLCRVLRSKLRLQIQL